ncbi:probable serine/threonine-protein kinase DDB_G0282963 isoform X2 [Condylostylus longicornis]|uniref:probable serine/threonine-protein kinase DDB_G0282963 isoform X2 n=1 Tax=Condylostylus longicornis TaxID=2530218 RepID=UPI00244E3046|nr:probable serine/threonine-protein kinase DDB_G0282963 isoform X2 [Condylostylus longicornis]
MLHHSADDLMVQQQMAIIDDLEYTSAKSAENKSEIVNCFQNTTEDQKEKSAITSKLAIATTATTQNKIDNDDVIELDSSPEKSNLKTLTSPNKDFNAKKISLESITTTLKENSLKMQPLEKVRETITKSNETSNIKSELKDQEDDRNEKCNESDQNKENIENNENQVNGKEDEITEIDNENQLDQNKDEKSMINEKQLFKDDENKEKQKNETTSRNDKNLELMDVSENEILNENKNDNKNLIKTEVKESSNYATNDIKINDNSKSPEPPTSINTTTNQLNNRKRLRSRSINEDQNESNISNNIRLTSTPLANHKDHNKEFINSTEPQNMSTATATKTVPLLNSTSTSTNAYNNNNNNCDEDDNVEQIHPMKKLRAELETNFTKHDSILAEYIERTTNETPDDIDKHISQLAIEIHTLNDMIKAKEYEWNNMLHLKKVKEEICFRLTRKKQVMELMATKLGEITNHIPNATTSIEQNLLGEKLSIAAQLKIPNLTNHHLLSSHSPPTTGATSATTPNPSLVAAQAAVAAAAAAAAASGGSSSLSSPSTVVSSSAAALAAMAAATSNLLNYSNAAATTISSAANKNNTNNFLNSNNEFSLNSTSTSAAQNILQLRANMKSSDLAKEKNSAQKIHRNILPKPSTATSSSQQQQLQQHQQLLATSLIQNAAANSGGGGASASQLAGLSGLFGSATAPVVLSSGASGGGGAAQIPLPLSNVATGSLMSAHTPPGATQTATTTNPNSVTSLNHQPTILNNYLTAAASVQQQLGELFNGHHNPNNAQNSQNLMVGRQGVFKDVKSIIADYRQRHPEQVPRRGRRMKSTNSNDVSVGATGQNRLSNSELNNLLNRLEANSRASDNDSSLHHSLLNNGNAAAAAAVAANLSTNTSANTGNISLKDVLVQFAKMSGRLNAAAAAAASAAAMTTPSLQNNINNNNNNNKNNNSNNNNSNNNNSNKNNNTKTANCTATTASYNSSIGQNNSNSNNPSTFPEVTLHPVSTTNQTADQSGSLLHGILTKYSRGGTSSSHSSNSSQNSLLNAVVAAGQQQQQQTSCAPTSTTTNYNSTFSPTLARLLTAPERITNNLSGSQNSTIGSHQTSTITAAQAAAAAAAAATSSSNSTGLNLTKVVAHNSEITITPVMNSNTAQQTALQHSLLQKQIKEALNISKNLNSGNTSDRIKSEYFMNMDDEADDSVDRLVIDEGGGDSGTGEEIHRIAPNAIGQEFHENEVPWCQGCKNQEAQFVCAGCGSQWYCSRECQVQAWDEHSETCTG